MLTKMRIGAAFALTAAAIIGCGSDKKTIIAGGSSAELNSNEFGAASSISQNNLASDKGGFSENNQNWIASQCRFNVKQAGADSANSSVDGTALIVFTTTDATTGIQRIYASHFDGSSFTIPVELTGVDREETLAQGLGVSIHTNSIVLIPLNTSGYKSGTTAGASDQLVRANAGNWLILWDAQTHTIAPLSAQFDTLSNSLAAADLAGTHHTVYANVFVKNLRNQPIATTNLIGNTATTGTANGPATTTKFGFQTVGVEITTFRGGVSNNMPGGAPAGRGFANRPAEDIISYGAATDGFVSCASFGSNTANPTGLVPAGAVGNVNGAFVTGPSTLGGTAAAPTVANNAGGAFPAAAAYTLGADTSFVQLFWTQLITSHTGGNTGTFGPANANATVQIGPSYRFLTANFDLASMTIKNQKIVPFPANRNGAQGTPVGALAGSAQAAGNFHPYKNMVFWNYFDASLNATNQGEGGVTGDVSQPLAVLRVIPGQNGTADIDAATQFDVSRNGPKHLTSVTNTVVGGSRPGNEFVTLANCFGVCRSGASSGSLFGSDEGLGDVTAFVLVRSDSNLSTSDTDIDTQLGVTAVDPATGLVRGGSQGTGTVRRISTHATEPFSAAINSNLFDSVFDVKTQISRDGTYIMVGWRQAIGTSINATVDLHATVYKTFRQAATTGTVGSAIVVNPTTLDQRLPTTAPLRVSTGTPVAYTNVTNLGLQGAPVAGWDWQGGVGYRCGFQSDITKLSVLYAYADGTEDRLFARQLTVTVGAAGATNPTLAAGTEAEFETTNLTSGTAILTGTFGIIKSTFRFIPGSLGLTGVTYTAAGGVTAGAGCTTLRNLGTGAAVDSRDAGNSGANGDVLVVFDKITDNTTTDGNFFDRKIIASRYTGAAVTDRAVISRNVHENVTNLANARTNLRALISRSTSASLSPAALAPDNGTYIYFQAPQNDNASSPAGVYTRRFKPQASTTSATTFTQLFVPAVGTAGTTNTFGANGLTTDTAFREPTRLDRNLSAAATPVLFLTDGKAVTVFIRQDNHIWASQTSDGDSYTNTNGLPTPALVDNNFSTSTATAATVVLVSCQKVDSKCDNLHGTILVILKNDVLQNFRAYVRVMQ